jgi:hypothetical protein
MRRLPLLSITADGKSFGNNMLGIPAMEARPDNQAEVFLQAAE